MRPLSSAMLGLALSLALFPPALAQSSLEQSMGEANAQPGPRTVPGRVIAVPDDVSPGLAADIAKPYRTPAWNANPPDDAAWLALIDKLAASAAAAQVEWREKLGVKMTRAEMAGVPVFILEPKEMPAENSNRVLLNLHGGGYVYGPGESGTGEAAVMAGYEHFRVIEVDYRMPPTHPYPAAMDDAMAVYKALLATTDPKHIAVFGTSTGGGMTLALMLRAKAEGVPLPAAIAPGTPWSDLTETGDSYRTNEWLDNILVSYDGYLVHAARLYAHGHDLKDPQLSPIYGDFHGLPPAILTSGTRDLFLSNTVRTHRKLREAGVEAQLQVFEGMSHAYYTIDPFTPESREVFDEIGLFLSGHLAK
jgi:monoterpene epsilon-lactone hydrolase